MAKKAKVVKEKSIEDRIWDSANKLRGNLTASEYQNVVLGLVFLKYISDCFEKRYNELVAEGDGFEEDRDEYTAEHVFWVPQDARWNVIASKAHSPEIGMVIDHALEEIGRENPRLKKVMPNNYSRPEIDKIRLGSLKSLTTWICTHREKASTSSAVCMNTACRTLPQRHNLLEVSSIHLPALSAP